MLRSVAISTIQLGLGFRSDLSDEIIAALQRAQRLLESGRTLPDFLKEEDQTLVVPAGTADVPLPTGFIREVGQETLHSFDPATQHTKWLEKFTDLDRMRKSLTGEMTSPGRPTVYYLRKQSIAFLPARDVSYNLIWSYYKGGLVLDTDIENVWLAKAPEALVGRAGMFMAELIGAADPGMGRRFDQFKSMYESGWLGAMADTIERNEENYPLQMGSRL